VVTTLRSAIQSIQRDAGFTPSNPLITIIATFPCGELYERFLHIKFKEHWHRDEWYRIEGNVAAWIARGCPHKKEIRSLLKLNSEREKAHAEWREAGAVKRRVRAAKAALSGRPAGPATWFEKWKEQNDTTVMEIPQVTT
jgi:hypothetical protein